MIILGTTSQATVTSARQGITRPAQAELRTLTGILDTPTLLFSLAALIFLWVFLFAPPFVPFLYNGDGMFFLHPGQRMYESEPIYRDFFEFVTPGTALVYFSLFKLFGLRLWIPNLVSLILGLGLAWLGVVISKKLMRPSLALLPSAIFLVGVREVLCQPTHHWFSLLTATAAIASLIDRRTLLRTAAAGFFVVLPHALLKTAE